MRSFWFKTLDVQKVVRYIAPTLDSSIELVGAMPVSALLIGQI